MKQKQLELFLQKIPSPSDPKPHLEQYQTPAALAADMLYTALAHGDIEKKTVIDLGCGTGIFSIGAVILGAKHAIGIDSDSSSINIAKRFTKNNNLSVEFIHQDVSSVDITGDTVVMNPPFGAQKGNENADRLFLKKAMAIAHVVYSLHLAETLPFLQKLIRSLQVTIEVQNHYDFIIPSMFSFHKDIKRTFSVVFIRISR